MRNIIIQDILYKWTFGGDRGDVCNSSILILSEDKNAKAIIKFKTKDTFTAGNPLNEGMPMIKNEIKYVVNLNQPKYIAEFIFLLLERGLDFSKKDTNEFDGNKMLLDMGYKDCQNYLL